MSRQHKGNEFTWKAASLPHRYRCAQDAKVDVADAFATFMAIEIFTLL